MNLYLVRHGQTAWNTQGRFQGSIDIELDDVGRVQARQLARRLAHEPIDKIVSSDLERAYETACLLAEPHRLTVDAEPQLRERNYGIFEGLTVPEMARRYPSEMALWQSHDPEYVIPQGESMAMFHARVMACVRELTGRFCGQTLVLVAHGGVLDMIYRTMMNLSLGQKRQCAIPNAALNLIRADEERWSILAWADTSHLDQEFDF